MEKIKAYKGQYLKNLRSKLLNKNFSRFRLVSGVIFYSLAALTTLLAVGFIIFTIPELKEKQFIFWLALLGTIAQLTVIWYLYYSTCIFSFARSAIYFCLMLSNAWLSFFIFSLGLK